MKAVEIDLNRLDAVEAEREAGFGRAQMLALEHRAAREHAQNIEAEIRRLAHDSGARARVAELQEKLATARAEANRLNDRYTAANEEAQALGALAERCREFADQARRTTPKQAA